MTSSAAHRLESDQSNRAAIVAERSIGIAEQVAHVSAGSFSECLLTNLYGLRLLFSPKALASFDLHAILVKTVAGDSRVCERTSRARHNSFCDKFAGK